MKSWQYRLPCWIGLLYLASFFLPTIDGFPVIRVGQGADETDAKLPCMFKIGGYHSGWNVFVQLAFLVAYTPRLTIFAIPAWVWFANPFFWWGLVLLAQGRWRAASLWGAAAVILGLLAVFILEGMSERPRVVHIGYFVWLASLVWLAGAGSVNWERHGPRRLEAS
jgi:hypothetical protein